MNSRTSKSLLVAVALLCATTFPHSAASARAPKGKGPQEQPSGGSVSINNQAGRVSVRLERGSRVSVSNRYGRITVTGWDRDTVEAVATSAKGPEAVQVEMTADPQARSTLSLAVVGRGRQPGYVHVPGTVYSTSTAEAVARAQAKIKEAEKRIEEKTKEAVKRVEEKEKEKAKGRTETPEGGVVIVEPPTVTVTPPRVVVNPGGVVVAPQPRRPAQPAGQPPRPTPAPRPGVVVGSGGGRADEIHLDVKVPRFAELQTVNLVAGDLNISGIDGPISIESRGGNVTASRVGALTVRTRGGDVNVDGVEGMVYVVANSGDITVRNAGTEVRATTNNGDINIQCARGRVDANTAFGKITLANVGDLVDAVTTNSDITFTGPIVDGGRYRLKSMEGRVVMSIPEGSPGFTANLMSYNRQVVSDFPFSNSTPNPSQPQAVRRGDVRHGNGRTIIMLDSFSQSVHLSKLAPGAAVPCR